MPVSAFPCKYGLLMHYWKRVADVVEFRVKRHEQLYYSKDSYNYISYVCSMLRAQAECPDGKIPVKRLREMSAQESWQGIEIL